MNYHKAAVYISQAWCLSASGRCSDKGCLKRGIASARWWERFGGKATIWLGQVDSFTLEVSATLTTAECNEVCTWLFNMTLTFSDGLHWKKESQQVWISVIYPCLLPQASLVQTGAGKFSAEWGTLEILLVGAGLMGSLPRSSGSPFVLEGSWKQGFQPRANPPTLSYLFQKNHSAYLSKRTRPGLLFHRKIWKGNRKLSFWVILQESGMLGRVGGRLCSPRCYS